jgi:hypothetical protein
VTAAPETDELWPDVGIDPVKLALPGGVVGYTLRAYRPAGEVVPTEAAPADEAEDPFAARERARTAEEAGGLGDTKIEYLHDPEARGEGPDRAGIAEEAGVPEEMEEEERGDTVDEEEVPLFLSHRSRLLLFSSPESLVEFVRSGGEHDLRQLDDWPAVVKRVLPSDVAPGDDDTYELDLVVENLRGGPDAWDLPLLISAGEIARDLGYALRLGPVITAMAPGSPLDDLDEALRATAAGGVGSMFARRRLRRIGAQQASLGWRTVIGKIAAVVDWHD